MTTWSRRGKEKYFLKKRFRIKGSNFTFPNLFFLGTFPVHLLISLQNSNCEANSTQHQTAVSFELKTSILLDLKCCKETSNFHFNNQSQSASNDRSFAAFWRTNIFFTLKKKRTSEEFPFPLYLLFFFFFIKLPPEV